MKKETYVVSFNDIDFETMNEKATKEDVEEFILSSNEKETIIYTKSIIKGNEHYNLVKNIIEKTGGYETKSYNITREEYEEKLNSEKRTIIKESRYHFVDSDERFMLSIYLLDNENLAFLDRFVANENRKDLPSFIKRAININDTEEIFNRKH